MKLQRFYSIAVVAALIAALSGCSGGLFSKRDSSVDSTTGISPERREAILRQRPQKEKRSTIWDLFNNDENPNTLVNVSKYIWSASLQVLDFLPVEAADPFTGVIVTGYGTPPGGGRAYRATIYIQDPALDARSLRVALMTRGGPASKQTVRAIEDAILTRARQLRTADGNL